VENKVTFIAERFIMNETTCGPHCGDLGIVFRSVSIMYMFCFFE
jgi:hypothetical protein